MKKTDSDGAVPQQSETTRSRRSRMRLSQRSLDNTQSSIPPTPGTLTRSGVSLAELKPGECGFIARLLGQSSARIRLLEMGLTPGVHVKVLRIAAFGGPLDIEVRGYNLSLRRDEATAVWLSHEDLESA